MPFTRGSISLLGVDESSGVAIAAGATAPAAVVDVLGDDASIGDGVFYLNFTGASATGTVDLKIQSQRGPTTVYSRTAFEFSLPSSVGTQRIPLGRRPISRYLNCEVKNSTGGTLTNVSLLCEYEKVS